jgi:hypothetical protein
VCDVVASMQGRVVNFKLFNFFMSPLPYEKSLRMPGETYTWSVARQLRLALLFERKTAKRRDRKTKE